MGTKREAHPEERKPIHCSLVNQTSPLSGVGVESVLGRRSVLVPNGGAVLKRGLTPFFPSFFLPPSLPPLHYLLSETRSCTLFRPVSNCPSFCLCLLVLGLKAWNTIGGFVSSGFAQGKNPTAARGNRQSVDPLSSWWLRHRKETISRKEGDKGGGDTRC